MGRSFWAGGGLSCPWSGSCGLRGHILCLWVHIHSAEQPQRRPTRKPGGFSPVYCLCFCFALHGSPGRTLSFRLQVTICVPGSQGAWGDRVEPYVPPSLNHEPSGSAVAPFTVLHSLPPSRGPACPQCTCLGVLLSSCLSPRSAYPPRGQDVLQFSAMFCFQSLGQSLSGASAH